jgi:coenzyme F420-reducing hydrogenase alpha subunit
MDYEFNFAKYNTNTLLLLNECIEKDRYNDCYMIVKEFKEHPEKLQKMLNTYFDIFDSIHQRKFRTTIYQTIINKLWSYYEYHKNSLIFKNFCLFIIENNMYKNQKIINHIVIIFPELLPIEELLTMI